MFHRLIKRFICLLGFLLLVCSSHSFSSEFLEDKLSEAKHDLAFKKYTSLYMPTVDWRILKAQCFQESLFDEEAISPVGAQGICQFMPGTWRGEIQRIGVMGSPFNAKLNIQVAASYMGQLRAQWSWKRPEWDRHSLAMASYNAGLGNILRAQQTCNDPSLYHEIIVCLPCITGQHSRETITYVQRIWTFYDLIKEDNRWLAL